MRVGSFVETQEPPMYPTDLTDTQWQVIKDLLADQRKRKHELRHVFNALFYVVKGVIPWRQMPNDLPPWKTVYRAGDPVLLP